METRYVRPKIIAVLGFAWAILLLGGFFLLLHEAYGATPRQPLTRAFPSNSPLTLDNKRPTLLVFAHPKCPCTRATFNELEQLRLRAHDRLAVTIVFTVPPHAPADFKKGELWNASQKMRGIQVFTDTDGIEARRFHVTGSGHVLVYTANGRLVYSGGITPSRGHVGDNDGLAAIVRLAEGSLPASAIERPVFGCTLL